MMQIIDTCFNTYFRSASTDSYPNNQDIRRNPSLQGMSIYTVLPTSICNQLHGGNDLQGLVPKFFNPKRSNT